MDILAGLRAEIAIQRLGPAGEGAAIMPAVERFDPQRRQRRPDQAPKVSR